MRYFTLIDFQHWVLALFLGLLAVVVVVVAWGLHPDPEPSDRDRGRERERLPPESDTASPPTPPVLLIIWIGALLWALGYALVQGVFGGSG